MWLATAVTIVVSGAVACGTGDGDGETRAAGPSTTVTSAPLTETTAAPSTTAPGATSRPSTTAVAPATTTPAPAATTTPPRLSSSSRLRIDGIGPIDVGMTIAEARAAAGTELSHEKEPYCDVLTPTRGPAGVDLVVTTPSTGRVELIVVKDGPIATVSGIRVGSTEAEVKAAYPGRLRAVNPSLPVHRLVYEPRDPALADRVLVFVIDGSRVATMYAGVRNQAEADEICA